MKQKKDTISEVDSLTYIYSIVNIFTPVITQEKIQYKIIICIFSRPISWVLIASNLISRNSKLSNAIFFSTRNYSFSHAYLRMDLNIVVILNLPNNNNNRLEVRESAS